MKTNDRVISEAAVPQGLIDSAHRKLSTILGHFPFALEAALSNLRMLSDSESPLAGDFAEFLNGPFGRTNPVDVGNRVVVGLITGNLRSGGSIIQTIGTMGYKQYGLSFDGTEIPTFINSPEARAAKDALVERIREIVNFRVEEVPEEINHMVKSGDTLSHLALKYGTTVAAIMDRNNLRSDLILVGQNLIIPQ